MQIKDLLKAMFQSFFVITTGVTMAMYLTCLLLYPDTVLTPGDIGGIFLVALLCDVSFLVFASRKELGKKQMAVRFCIHIPLVHAIVLGLAWKWDWVNIDKPLEVAVFVLLILGVYAIVLAVGYRQDKKTADRLNDSLKKKYHS